MEAIFEIEFHPVHDAPRRMRFLLESTSERIVRVTEERRDGDWVEINSEVVTYLEYSDEETERPPA